MPGALPTLRHSCFIVGPALEDALNAVTEDVVTVLLRAVDEVGCSAAGDLYFYVHQTLLQPAALAMEVLMGSTVVVAVIAVVLPCVAVCVSVRFGNDGFTMQKYEDLLQDEGDDVVIGGGEDVEPRPDDDENIVVIGGEDVGPRPDDEENIRRLLQTVTTLKNKQLSGTLRSGLLRHWSRPYMWRQALVARNCNSDAFATPPPTTIR
jgi:hypothetical protein